MGPIADRTIEHLGVSDTAIIKLRRLLLQTLNDSENGGHAARPRSARLSRALGPFHFGERQVSDRGVDEFVRIKERLRRIAAASLE